MKYYKQLRQGVSDKNYKLISSDAKVWDYINDDSKDWYTSIYEYNQKQFWEFQKTGSISGIDDVTTSKLVWDFDNKEDIQKARADTIVLCTNLRKIYNIPENAIQIYFSGNKGFHVELETTSKFTVQEFKNVTQALAQGLQSFDKSVSDAARIIRVAGTKHKESGLYKFPLTIQELSNNNVEKIKELAQDINNSTASYECDIEIPNNLLALKTTKELKKEKKDVLINHEIDFTKKPKGWSNCKWALSQGYQVQSGDRTTKLLSLIATSRSLNFSKEQAYYLAKNSFEKGHEFYGGEELTESRKKEIWGQTEQVYSPMWHGGTYSCRDGKTAWLSELCDSLGRHKCQAANLGIVTTSEVFTLFNDYAENFEKNILKTGLDELDQNAKFMVGTSNGILAPPGVGKTTMSLNILNYNSNQGNPCVFFSYDMFHSLVYLRLIQKHFGYGQDKIFDIFKHDKKEAGRIQTTLDEEYKNVHFCFKSGQTADEIYETIMDTEDKIGKKVKLALVDYNELVISGFSDPTQSSAQVAQRLRQIANDTSTCVVTLLQPSKVYSNPSDEISTYQGAKGSGAIAQSLSLMLSLSRPGFSPRTPKNDKFITINALKHRQGPLFTLDLYWDGLSGQIRTLSDEEKEELNKLKEEKFAEKNNTNTGGF